MKFDNESGLNALNHALYAVRRIGSAAPPSLYFRIRIRFSHDLYDYLLDRTNNKPESSRYGEVIGESLYFEGREVHRSDIEHDFEVAIVAPKENN